MGISVERLRNLNEKLQQKIDRKKSSNSEPFTIEIETITGNDSLSATTSSELLNNIPVGVI